MLDQIAPRKVDFYSDKRSITDTFQQCKKDNCVAPNLPTCLPNNFMEILSCTYCGLDEPELKDFANAFCRVDLNENCETKKLSTTDEKILVPFFTNGEYDQSVNVSWTTSELKFHIRRP